MFFHQQHFFLHCLKVCWDDWDVFLKSLEAVDNADCLVGGTRWRSKSLALGLSKCHCQFFWGVILRFLKDQRSYHAFSKNRFWICNYLIRLWLFVTFLATNKGNFRQIPKKWWFNKKPSLLQTQIPEHQWEWYWIYHKESTIPGSAGRHRHPIDPMGYGVFLIFHPISQRDDMGNLGIVPELCIPPACFFPAKRCKHMEEIFRKQPTLGYSPNP